MNRQYFSFRVNDIDLTKQQMLSWINRFSICCFMDSHQYKKPPPTYECLAAAGVLDSFEPGPGFFKDLAAFEQFADDWIFGHFNYEIKQKVEPHLLSHFNDLGGFPDCFLFVPEIVLLLKDQSLTIGIINEDVDEIFQQITSIIPEPIALPKVTLQPRQSKEEYIQAVNDLKDHIHYGDCYVINYCQEFIGSASVNPLSVYRQLSVLSPNPFGVYYKVIDNYLMCASPERFIKKSGNKLISQPIKGTVGRDRQHHVNDQKKISYLQQNNKERSENVMVVDLVRNDMGKFCQPGSVQVDELFGIYSFPHVHHMISTVSGVVDSDICFARILEAMFPMGSMTGAPKIKVMELTEQYEKSKRGIYSGTVGYISPEKDFDFNVVIRSLVYNETRHTLSFHVGSAITSYCNPEKEYEECLLKGAALMKIFQ